MTAHPNSSCPKAPRPLFSGLLASGLLAILVSGTVPAAAAADAPNPDAVRLAQRLQVIEADASLSSLASYERLQARQAIDALTQARSRARADALQVAEWRVEVAEIAVKTQVTRREIDRLDRERSELLVEASRREASRARQEAERLRVQAQIQAEEAQRLRQAAEEEAAARQEAETVLQGVAGDQAAKLRAARQRAAELKRQEEALLKSLENDSGNKR